MAEVRLNISWQLYTPGSCLEMTNPQVWFVGFVSSFDKDVEHPGLGGGTPILGSTIHAVQTAASGIGQASTSFRRERLLRQHIVISEYKYQHYCI